MSLTNVIHTGAKFQVERHDVITPKGHAHGYDVVVHPGAAVVLPILDDGHIVLERNYRYTVDAYMLELPAGTLEPDEPPEVCAARELTEETGYVAGHLEPLCSFFSSPGFCTELLHVFVATKLRLEQTNHEPGEVIELEPLTHDLALAAIRTGRIRDGKTIAALLYYDRFVHGQEQA